MPPPQPGKSFRLSGHVKAALSHRLKDERKENQNANLYRLPLLLLILEWICRITWLTSPLEEHQCVGVNILKPDPDTLRHFHSMTYGSGRM